MKKIYIIVSNSGSLVSKVLMHFTHQKYVHVTIALDDNLKEAYSFGRKFTYVPLPGGFINEKYDKRYKHFKNSYFKIYELKVSNNKFQKLKNNLKNDYLINKKKYKYNIIGLYYIQRKKIHHREKHLLCSQFCSKILIDNNILTFAKDYSLIKPEDFLNIENTNVIYEGKTIDYLKIKNRI